jgi:hypothetical protein
MSGKAIHDHRLTFFFASIRICDGGTDSSQNDLRYHYSPAKLCDGGIDSSSIGLCPQRYPDILTQAAQWTMQGCKAEYCLSQTIPASDGVCGYNFNIAIIVVVLICNIGKLDAMSYVGFGTFSDPLITIGDAAASFLEAPDSTTGDMCLSGREDIVAAGKGTSCTDFVPRWPNYQSSKIFPKDWQPIKKRWLNAASVRRWSWCLVL